MKVSPVITAYCFLQCLFITFTAVNGGFILTSPKVIDAGSTVYFTITVFGVPEGETVTLQLRSRNELIAESPVTVRDNYNMWVEMHVPAMSSDISAKLHVMATFSNGYTIEADKDVRIRHNTILTFVQTDKPLYKPGQTIKFRVLPMNNQLKPLSDDTVGDIWIEDPSGIRVEQWKEVKFTDAIRQFELPLSDEPPLGTWKINTEINKVSSSQTFRVEKYVLPKFDVIINPPDVVMADAETITTEICSKYTYGKIVVGTLSARVTYESHAWDSSIPSVEYLGQISGCHKFVVNTDDLLLQSGNFGYRTLKIIAEVTENGTGIVRNATAQVEITHYPLYIDFVKNNLYYKQKLPYYGYVQVKKRDKSPAASEKIQICARFIHEKDHKESCRVFTSDKTGLIPFSIAPSTATKIMLKASAINYELVSYFDRAWQTKIGVPHANMILYPWYSPSGSYLQIETTTDEFPCDKLQQVKVRYTAKQGTTIKFYHQVLSKGRIVQQGSHQRTFYSKSEGEIEYDLHEEYHVGSPKSYSQQEVGEFILSFNPSATMSPKARLLIFYVREDKEVVADSKMFYIKKCLQNKVNLLFRHEQQYPSTEAAMLLSANPSSLCGISMVDKSIRLLRKDETFNKQKLFKLMEAYDIGRNDPPNQVTANYCTDDAEPLLLPGIRDPLDFDDYPYRNNDKNNQYVDAVMAFEEAGMVVITDLKINTRPCQRVVVLPLFMMSSKDGKSGRALLREEFDAPPEDNAPERVILREAKPVKALLHGKTPKSTEEIRSYFPETWLWELHNVGQNGETAIKRQLPHTVTQWTGGAVCVHPKTGLGISEITTITAFQPFFLDFQLPYSVIRGETLSLIVSVFNYLTECLPIKLSLEPSEDFKLLSELRYDKVCVCGGQSVSSTFLIRPVTLGEVNITVYGFSIEDDDEICGNEITARLSARDAVTKQLLVEAEGFPKEEVYNYLICPEKSNGSSYAAEIDLLLPEDVIADSSRAYMTVTGDIMGPALNGLENLVRLPCGCGEQNMILFVPNIFVLDYLKATGKLTEDIEEKSIRFMKTGYQRELKYRHDDGSYSAFGSSDKEGSVWLTAFVLRSFGQARRFISIDEKDLSLSTAWILKMQFENGCFRPSGMVHHKEMKGGLRDGEQSLAPLTAYVLISLLESGIEQSNEMLVKNGLKCLESENSPDNYGLALFAYASILSKELIMAEKYLKELDERAITKGNQKFWKSSSASKSVGVEIASYYILARLEMEKSDGVQKALPVVRWITQQRNSNGGFVSTQDTVVALQALAKYATYQSQDKVDIGLEIEIDDLSQGFRIDEENKLVTQSMKIPTVPAVAELQAVGDGCAFVQFSLRYNVERVPGNEAFDLNVDARRLGSNDCNLPRLSICMRYKIPGQKSNMVVLSVKMASGFAPDEWSLLLLENDPEIQLKRHEIKGNEVNLYFEELRNHQKCFTFFMKSEFEVEDIKPSIIQLYDYYQPEQTVSAEYTISNTCNVTSLPELPWLPSLDFDFHDDEPIDVELSEPLAFNDTEKIEFPNFPTVPIAPDDLPIGWESTEALPYELQAKNSNEFGVLSNADQSGHKVIKNSTHLLNFVDTDHDLDFPDGLEANMPVSVLPPEENNCPICDNNLPENFTEVYCNSAFALKVVVRDGNSGTVKILQDLSFYNDNPKSIKKFGKLEYEDDCICPQLKESGKVLFVVGSPLNLWKSGEKKHSILLKQSVYVLSLQWRDIQTFITDARNSCSDDP